MKDLKNLVLEDPVIGTEPQLDGECEIVLKMKKGNTS